MAQVSTYTVKYILYIVTYIVHTYGHPHMGAEGQGDPPRVDLVNLGHCQRVQHDHKAVQAVPSRVLVHLVQGGAGHPQQEAGDLLNMQTQGKAHTLAKRSRG